MVASAVARWGAVHTLLNVAAVTGAALVDDTDVVATSLDTWDRVVDVNLRGTMLCCRQVVPVMLGARRRVDREHLVERRHPRVARARRLLGEQGGGEQPHHAHRGRVRQAGHPLQRDHAGRRHGHRQHRGGPATRSVTGRPPSATSPRRASASRPTSPTSRCSSPPTRCPGTSPARSFRATAGTRRDSDRESRRTDHERSQRGEEVRPHARRRFRPRRHHRRRRRRHRRLLLPRARRRAARASTGGGRARCRSH